MLPETVFLRKVPPQAPLMSRSLSGNWPGRNAVSMILTDRRRATHSSVSVCPSLIGTVKERFFGSVTFTAWPVTSRGMVQVSPVR